MAKGDRVTVWINAGATVVQQELTASKAGRTVRQRIATRQKVQWLDVKELTRTNRETGRTLSVRLDSVVAVHEERLDDDAATLPRIRRVNLGGKGYGASVNRESRQGDTTMPLEL